MDSWQLDDKGLVSACPQCGQKNRLAYASLGSETRCGRCKQALAGPAVPVDVPSVQVFDTLMATSALPVVIDYWAAWCGPCRMVAPELAKIAAANAGRLLVAKVDTEALPEIAQRLGIQSIPMMTVSAGGREKGRTVGARPARDIQAFIDQSLRRG